MIKDEENGKPICSFRPMVISVVEKITTQRTESHVRLKLHFKEGNHVECVVAISAIDKVDWFQIDRRCIINKSYHKSKEYIATLIRMGIANAPIEKQYCLDRLGIHNIDGEIVFVAGDRVITQSPDKPPSNIKSGVPSIKLDVDPKLTANEAFEGMRELISLSPEIGKVLVAHAISGITRAAFKKAGITPCAVLVVVGKTGMLKSHYVSHIVQLYDRTDGVSAATRFNSTQRFIEDILYEYSECTAVIDDIHTAEASGIKRTNEATAEEIIRRIGDDTGRGHKEGNRLVQKKFRGNVVFIGEYAIGKESTVPRALVVNLTKPINSTILDKYQRHKPLLVSTFYDYFINWYVKHFNDIRDEIDKRLTKFRERPATGMHLRLKDTQFYLQTSYMLFLEFCKELGVATSEEIQDEDQAFASQLAMLIQAQQAQMRPEKDTTVNYLKIIQKLYKNRNFCLADSEKEFDQDKHDGLIHYGCLCLRRENLEKRIRTEFRKVKINEVIEELLNKDALKLVKEKNTVKISTLSEHKGMRFYAIFLELLD